MRKPNASKAFLSAFESQVVVAPAGGDTLEEKQAFWRSTLNYDPYGLFGAQPHTGQMELHNALMRDDVKVVVVRAGKRGGKSTAALAEALYTLNRRKAVWVASASYELADVVFGQIWSYVVASSRFPINFKDRRNRKLEIAGGGSLAGKSWENKDQLEGYAVDLLVADEAQKLDDESFRLLYARTTDRRGKMVLIGSEQESSATFDDLCEQAEIRDNWEFVTWKTAQNPGMPPEELEEARQIMSKEQFEALFEAKKRPDHLAVFPEFDKSLHVRPLELDPNEPITLWIDPGHNYYAALAVQVVTNQIGWEEVRVLDEVYMSPATNAKVIQECQARDWWPLVIDAVIDIAGTQHGPNSELSPAEEWELRGKIMPRYQVVSIRDGIERTRTALKDPRNGRPRILFDPRCGNTIDEFRGLYRYRKNKDGGRSASDLPMDKANHAAKAIAYGLTDLWGRVGFDRWTQPMPVYGQRRRTAAQEMNRWFDNGY